jgi:DNA-binding transcriptional LysR family regulator
LTIEARPNTLFGMANNKSFASLDDLSVFLAVTRGGGFRTAARWLGVSPSTASDTISRLEKQLGVPLFIRTTRSVQLTEAGHALAKRIEPVMAEARAALHDAASSQGQVKGSLKLHAPGAVMVDILPPLISGFLAVHPEVQMEVLVDDRPIDITAKGCDAGVRYGEHLAQDMIAVPIGPRRQWGALAASPNYLKSHDIPTHPRDLLKHECIRMRFASGALTQWEFKRGSETLIVDPPARVVVGTAGASASIDLAIAGRGLLYTFRNWLDPHLESGALLPILPDWWHEFDGPRLYFSSRLMPKPLRAFIDYIADQRIPADTAKLP